MDLGNVTQKQSNESGSGGRAAVHLVAKLGLRLVVIAFTVVGAVTVANSHQIGIQFNIPIEARYSYSSALKFKLGADFVVCGLSVVSVILLLALSRTKTNPRNYFYLFLLDLVCLVLLVAGCSAATAIGMVARYGQLQSGWHPICNYVQKFCGQLTFSTAASFLAVIFLLLLTIISVYNLYYHPISATCV